MVIATFRFIAFLIGLLAYYAAFCMHEDEEGVWQDRIEALWVQIDDRRKQVGSLTVALFSRVAQALNLSLNRVFGPKLFSLRMIGASVSYSWSILVILALLIPGQSVPNSQPSPYALAAMACALFACAILPTIFKTPWLVIVSLIPLSAMIFYIWADATLHLERDPTREGSITLGVAIPFSVITDLLLTIQVRSSLRRMAQEIRVAAIVIAALTQLACGVTTCVGPFLLMALIGKHHPITHLMRRVLEFSGALNFSSLLFSLTFTASILFVLLHRIVWPLLDRIVYPIQRHKLIHNQKVLAGVGTVCLLAAFNLVPNVLKAFLDFMPK